VDEFSRQLWRELLPNEEDLLSPAAASQERGDKPLDHYTAPVLLERAAYLRKLAKLGDGSASDTLKEYPQHSTMLSVRIRSGIAELHEDFADLFFVLEGRATLVTGGTVVDPKTIAPGEIRGSSVAGGLRQELRAGDVAHVAAGTPHQMLLAGDKTVTCMVVKIQENPRD
jgi:mannose-6-phosphate isomerase-like protein (cupin superfamily)